MYLQDEIQNLKNKIISWNYKNEDLLFILKEINDVLIYWQLSSDDEKYFIEKYREIIDYIDKNNLYTDSFDYLEYKAYFYYLNWKTQRLLTLINSYKLFKNNDLLILLIQLLIKDNSDKDDVFEYINTILDNWIENIYIYRKLKSLLIWKYEFDLSNINENNFYETIEWDIWEITPKIIEWIWEQWYCLDDHTVLDINSSRWYSNSYVWGLLNDIKYHYKKELVWQLSKIIWDFLIWKYKKFTNNKNPFEKIDFIIITPPSKLDRPFQPVLELWKKLSENTWIPLFNDLLIKTRQTPQTKTMTKEEAKRMLDWIFEIKNKDFFTWKNILIFDDLFWTWTTLNEISKTIKNQTKINKIFVLTITKTRTKSWLRF